MSKGQNGVWIKYEKSPGKWHSKDSSYTRLCADLKPHQNTGWPIGKFADYIHGEFIPCDGTPDSDIYVYYLKNRKKGVSKPKLCLAVHECDDGKYYAAVYGIRTKDRSEEHRITYKPAAKYLPVLVEKLRELNAKDWQLEEYTNSLHEYQNLVYIAQNGVVTDTDLLTIYKNLGRADTTIAQKLVRGRNIQEDYDSLALISKINFVKIICGMSSKCLARLAYLTNTKGSILSVNEIAVLRNTATATSLLCLRYAPKEYLENKETMLEILKTFDITQLAPQGLNYISETLQIDIDVLRALVSEQPYKIERIIGELANKKNDDANKLLIEKLKDRTYMLSLLDMHFRNCITHLDYQKESFLPCGLLWNFPLEMTEGIETEILQGPFATPEEEQMKSKVLNAIKLERIKVADARTKHPEYFE